MEEQVGRIWHRMVSRAATTHYPNAEVTLREMQQLLGVLFRALGGDGGLRVEVAEATRHGARRGVWQRIAGSGEKVELAWRDEEALHLPAAIACFAERELNRELYLWLAALAAAERRRSRHPWLLKNQALVQITLTHYPGLMGRYQRLVTAHIAQRDSGLRMLYQDEYDQEVAVRQALINPGSVPALPVARSAPLPVPLWLHPSPPGITPLEGGAGGGGQPGGGELEQRNVEKRGRGERRKPPQEGRGLITIRMENILTWGEYIDADRSVDENDDLDQAADAARDADRFSVTRDDKPSSSKLRFDLDLPSADCDEEILEQGLLLPEWDWKAQRLIPDHCRVMTMAATDAAPCQLPPHLRRTARQLRAQFQQLLPTRSWIRGCSDGIEIDIDGYLRYAAARHSGAAVTAEGLYRDLRPATRDLACLLLADLSLSTDTWVDNHRRVVDVIRESLYLFSESLSTTGDRFALYGFSSRKRDPIRMHRIKSFTQPYNDHVRGRIEVIKPGYYTRMGAAIRYAQMELEAQPAERRLLLILSDGKPNDLDKYEGRYGIEDTRHAILQARRSGMKPFCVTIDERGNDYLPYIFGSGGYVVIRNPSELPRKLPLLYARMTKE